MLVVAVLGSLPMELFRVPNENGSGSRRREAKKRHRK